ncbi:hypothetical protein E8E15_000380 [Penicillium rubens]|nr:hypothetical protein E8E15_000380 [Penicillium rubens]
MPARAHRRAPDPLAGAVNPLPPCRGLSPMAPRGSGLALPGSLSPGKVPPPRACTPRLAPRARPPASRAGFASTSPAGAANSPAAPTGAPRPPSQGREAPPAAPRPGAGGGGTAGGARLRGDRRAGGSYREGHPARAPTVTSPAIPAPPTQRDAATLAGPHSLSPGPLGPGRFYTDSPTPFGV